MKELTFSVLAFSVLATGSIFAYQSENSLTARYYRGEIGTQEYIDRQYGLPPVNGQPQCVYYY